MNDLNIPDLPDRRGFKPFTRLMTTPAAWPWNQTRAVELEARHTSPVSGDDVAIVMRRLLPWKPGESGKFVAIYLRGRELRDGLKLDLDIEGRRISIDMPSPQTKADQARQGIWRIGLAAVMIVCILAMALITLHRRTAEADRLTELETVMKGKVRDATGVARARDDAEALAHLDLGNRTMNQALNDLKILSLQRDPAAKLDAFYWNKGYWAVEVRGDTPPVKDATVPLQRSTKPVRKGTWLWVSAVEDGAQ